MQFLQFTEFRNKSREFLDAVENGNSYVIVRRGKPIAQVTPFKETVTQGWKRPRILVKLKGTKTTTDYLMEERDER
jgi:prevent-host-death family protein